MLINLPFHEIVKYKVTRDTPLLSGRKDPWKTGSSDVDLATYEKQNPRSLFNKGVRTQDEKHLGHVMKETDDAIVVWGHYDWRFDAPKSKIIAVGRNVILGLDYKDAFKYKVSRDVLLPTGQQIDLLGEEKRVVLLNMYQNHSEARGLGGVRANSLIPNPTLICQLSLAFRV